MNTTASHLAGFLLVHAGFRIEFGKLAGVLANPRSTEHAAVMVEHITVQEWEAHTKQVVQSHGRRRVPILFCWAVASGTPDQARTALAAFPLPVRLLFRLVWWPKYRRRYQRLYGVTLRRNAT